MCVGVRFLSLFAICVFDGCVVRAFGFLSSDLRFSGFPSVCGSGLRVLLS
jgi:hypothetical protein